MDITWRDKVNNNSSQPLTWEEKFTPEDANEIKAAVNSKFDKNRFYANRAALKATTETYTDGTVVYLACRSTNGDGGDGFFLWDASNLSVPAAQDAAEGVYIKKNGTTGSTGAFVRQFSGDLSILWFGAVKNNVAIDSSAAINTAIALATYYGGLGTVEKYPSVRLPAGKFYCHEITWDNVTSLVGTEVGTTTLIYNGAGGNGTSLIVNNKNLSGATPFAGFYNLQLVGFDNVVGHGIAETGYRMNGPGGTDWGAKFENLQFMQFFGDALDLSGGLIANCHMNRIRFDSIGGFCIKVHSGAGGEARPFSVYQFTYDNNLSGNFATQAYNIGYYDGVRWGKGLLSAVDCAGVYFSFNDGRIELNKRLTVHDTRPTMFFINNTLAGTYTSVALKNVGGFFHPFDCGSTVFAKSGWCNFSSEADAFYNNACFFEDFVTPARNVYNGGQGLNMAAGNDQLHTGISFRNNSIEYRSEVPGVTIYRPYKAGDIIFRAGGSAPYLGWVCTWPSDGVAVPAAPNYGNIASINSASYTVTLSTSDYMSLFPVGKYITIAGAGAGGTALTTRITAVNSTALTLTVEVAASTTVSGAALSIPAATFSTFGEICLYGTITWDPANLVDGAGETSNSITVTGAALGDYVVVAAPYDLQGMICSGYVSASNTVKIRVQNESGGAIDLASGVWKVKVTK